MADLGVLELKATTSCFMLHLACVSKFYSSLTVYKKKNLVFDCFSFLVFTLNRLLILFYFQILFNVLPFFSPATLI